MKKLYSIKKPVVVESPEDELYSYKTYIGKHNGVNVEKGDSAWIVDNSGVRTVRGPKIINTSHMCVIIRGYVSDSKYSGYESGSNLPYVNGCTSNQLIPPTRVGDPTAQLLFLPKFTKEQAHHIHSTARIVYVLKGKGKSIQGMKGNIKKINLKPGKILIVDKNLPHHFETKDNELTVIPIHIFSSTYLEFNHPMFNGTFAVDKQK